MHRRDLLRTSQCVEGNRLFTDHGLAIHQATGIRQWWVGYGICYHWGDLPQSQGSWRRIEPYVCRTRNPLNLYGTLYKSYALYVLYTVQWGDFKICPAYMKMDGHFVHQKKWGGLVVCSGVQTHNFNTVNTFTCLPFSRETRSNKFLAMAMKAMWKLTSLPGLLTSAFVACSTVVSTASNKRRGEKAWERGYMVATSSNLEGVLFPHSTQSGVQQRRGSDEVLGHRTDTLHWALSPDSE